MLSLLFGSLVCEKPPELRCIAKFVDVALVEFPIRAPDSDPSLDCLVFERSRNLIGLPATDCMVGTRDELVLRL